ncbi:MAG TPA: DUF1080 domain-containing protein [Sphingobacterium sp.]|nr:DUF1080 domain-containing protein [Sphingobacterium sp.]
MMAKIFSGILVLTVLWTLSSCKVSKAQQSDSSEADLPMASLKDLKKNKEGAYILFDGTSLKGWRGYGRADVPGKWSIEDGSLKFSGKVANMADSEGGDIIFAHRFKNFELSFDWKISKGGNSGVFYLAQEIKGKPIYISAPEFQVLDNESHPDAKQGKNGNRKSASLYDMIPAQPQNAKPFGEWNSSKIVVNNGKIAHYQNGVKVVEYTVWDDSWVALLEDSKFSSAKWPEAFGLLKNLGGSDKSGFIGLQDHRDDVWFRNITVKVLK